MKVSRRIFNIVGGTVTVASLALPWRIVNGINSFLFYVPFSTVPWDSIIVLSIALLGGLISFRSRLGGIPTIVGLLTYLASLTPTVPPSNVTPTDILGPGFWTAIAGVVISFFGKSQSIPSLSALASKLRRRNY